MLLIAGATLGQVRAEGGRADEAQRRFDEGKALLKADRTQEACAAFAASDELEAGIGVRMVLAACRERQGLLATAHADYLLAAERARAAGDAREATARASAAELLPRVPVLVLQTEGPLAPAPSPTAIR